MERQKLVAVLAAAVLPLVAAPSRLTAAAHVANAMALVAAPRKRSLRKRLPKVAVVAAVVLPPVAAPNRPTVAAHVASVMANVDALRRKLHHLQRQPVHTIPCRLNLVPS